MISIIIATYNSEHTLRTALESVLNQTFQDWECIVVDGASKDGTVDIVKEYVAKDSRFRYISEPDKGIYDAFNKGWRMAKGEWVHYLGSDDKLTSNGLFDLLKESHDNYGIISGHCYIEKIDGSIKPNYSRGFYGCHQGKLTRKSILEKLNGFNMNYPILADKDLLIRAEKIGVKIKNIDTFVAYFAMDGVSQNIKGIVTRGKERYLIMRNNNIPYACLICVKISIKDILSIIYRSLKTRI